MPFIGNSIISYYLKVRFVVKSILSYNLMIPFIGNSWRSHLHQSMCYNKLALTTWKVCVRHWIMPSFLAPGFLHSSPSKNQRVPNDESLLVTPPPPLQHNQSINKGNVTPPHCPQSPFKINSLNPDAQWLNGEVSSVILLLKWADHTYLYSVWPISRPSTHPTGKVLWSPY